jgi:hypothetical protein
MGCMNSFDRFLKARVRVQDHRFSPAAVRRVSAILNGEDPQDTVLKDKPGGDSHTLSPVTGAPEPTRWSSPRRRILT